jgi:hypothetical protein
MWTIALTFLKALNPRIWAGLAMCAAIAASNVYAYRAGAKSIRTAWDQAITQQALETLKISEQYRATEKILQTKVQKVSTDYEAAKKINAALADRLSGSLRDLNTELDRSASESAQSPTVNHGATAESQILRSCAGSIRELAEVADGFAEQIVALQGYIISIQTSGKSQKVPTFCN